MSTFKKWTYSTGGFPQSLHQTTYTPPAPSSLKPTEVQVRTKAFAINPVDVQAMNLYGTSSSSLWWPVSTLIGSSGDGQERETCCDFSGTVIHAGPRSGYTMGEEVFGFTMAPMNGLGTAGEVLTFDAASSSVAMAKKPENWDHVHAAAIPLVWLTARVSIDAVHSYIEQSRDKWLVVLGGSSSTGTCTIQLAKSRGWKVLSTCSTRNVDFVRNQLLADEVIDYTAVSSVPGEIFQKLHESLQKGDQVVVVDCVGGTECLEHKDLGAKIVRYVTIVGDKTDRSSMGGPAIYSSHPKMLMRWILGRLGLGVHYDCVILEAKKEWLEEAGRTLGQDDIVVDSTFKFSELPAALEKMVGGRVRGKLVGNLG